ncbi:MAG: ABC transporter permease [Acidithiobacillus sp.]|jgi:ABC-type nitrate/sulfonate/bicarbonate transport system permease component
MEASKPMARPERSVGMGAGAVTMMWSSASIGLFLSIWYVAAHYIHDATLLPTPFEVARSMVKLVRDGSLITDVSASLKRVSIGFFAAAVIAVPLAMVMAYNRLLCRLVLPVIQLLRPIPPIAWIPIGILWFGIGNETSYFITAVAAFAPIFLNAFSGGLATERQHIHAAKTLGASKRAIVRYIMFPSALPMIWTGLKIGLGQSWMAVVTAELVAAQSGLGYMIEVNRLNLDTPSVIVGMAAIGVLGAAMTVILNWCEQYIFPWKQAERQKGVLP